MKTRTIDFVYRSLTVMSILMITVAGPALAGRPPAHKNLDMWTGGNHPSQSNQAPPAISNGNAEIMNQDDSGGDDQARYKVIRIGVLPGKTASFLTIVRAVNNREHVTGYSFIAAGFGSPRGALTGQGFIWRDGKLEALPLLEGWPGAFAFGINDRDQVVGAANNVDADGNLIHGGFMGPRKANKPGSSSSWLDFGGAGCQYLWRSCRCFRYFYERTSHTC